MKKKGIPQSKICGIPFFLLFIEIFLFLFDRKNMFLTCLCLFYALKARACPSIPQYIQALHYRTLQDESPIQTAAPVFLAHNLYMSFCAFLKFPQAESVSNPYPLSNHEACNNTPTVNTPIFFVITIDIIQQMMYNPIINTTYVVFAAAIIV